MVDINSSSKNNSRELARQFLRAAATLRLEINGRNETYNFKKLFNRDGCAFVIYVVDTDIATCFTNPKIQTKRADFNSYGNIFPKDGDDAEIRLGLVSTLASYIFDELDTNWPIFQLPSHYKETEKVYAAVANKAQKSSKGKARASLLLAYAKERAQQKEQRTSDLLTNFSLDDSKEKISNSVLKVAKQIIEKEKKHIFAIEELKKYFQLQSSGCALSLEKGIDISRGNSSLDDVRHAFNGAFEREGGEYAKFHTLTDLWMVRLAAQKSQLSRDKFITDAEALATLEIINSRLPENGRIIFITGDTALLNAARQEIAFGCKDEFDQNYFTEFARKNIRHFHAFFADCFVGKRKDEQQEFETWLDGFLGTWASSYLYKDEKLQELANGEKGTSEIDSMSSEEINDLIEDWQKFRTYAVNWSLVRQNQVDKSNTTSLERIVNKLDAVETVYDLLETFSKFETTTENIKQNIWEEFVLDLSQTGTEFLFQGATRPARHSPNIRFQSLGDTTDIFQKYHNGDYQNNPELFDVDLGKIKRQTEDQKPGKNALGYLYYIVFAGAFAQASKWATALSLSDRAIHIIETSPSPIFYPDQNSHFSGREAYYIAAISSRICAKDMHAIEGSKKYLRKAYRALEIDHGAGTAENIKGIRFDIEAFSIELSTIYLKSFYINKKNTPYMEKEGVPTLEVQAASCWADCKRAVEHEGNNNLRTSLPIAGLNCLQVMTLKLSTARGNELQDMVKGIKSRPEIEQWHKALECVSQADSVSNSYLIASYGIVAKTIMGHKPNFYKHFNKQDMEAACVTRYDRKRFDWLLALCELTN